MTRAPVNRGEPAKVKSYVKIAAVAVVLAAALALGFWGYVSHQTRALNNTVLALVQDSTSGLGEALGLLTAGAEARRKLEADFAALGANMEKLRAVDASWNEPLVRAADGYISEIHAMLRRQIAAHRSRDAVHADMKEIAEHLRGAAGRSSAWIRQALALKQRLETNFFNYRLAAGGLEKSLRSLREARAELGRLVAPDLVIEENALAAAAARWIESSAKLGEAVEKTRSLPEPR